MNKFLIFTLCLCLYHLHIAESKPLLDQISEAIGNSVSMMKDFACSATHLGSCQEDEQPAESLEAESEAIDSSTEKDTRILISSGSTCAAGYRMDRNRKCRRVA